MMDWNVFISFAWENRTLLVSIAALIVAIISLVKTSKAQKIERQVNEIDLKLKKIALEKTKKVQEKNACVEARMVKIGQSNYRLIVWNSGNAAAKNVTVHIEEQASIRLFDEEMCPFEILEPNKNFELIAVAHTGSARKFKVDTVWENTNGAKETKEQWCTL